MPPSESTPSIWWTRTVNPLRSHYWAVETTWVDCPCPCCASTREKFAQYDRCYPVKSTLDTPERPAWGQLTWREKLPAYLFLGYLALLIWAGGR